MTSILKVDTIQDSGGNAIITSDGAGNVSLNTTIENFVSTGIDDNATSTAITIDSSQNVGIGTTSPDNPLHVVGDSTFEHRTNVEFKIQDATDAGGGTRLSSIWKASGSDVEIGNIEIDLTDGTTGSEDSQILFKTIGNGTLAEAMRIDSSNVGIGTTSPTSKLTVSGNVAHVDVQNSSNSSVALIGASGSTGDAPNRGYLRLRKDGSTNDGISLNTNGSSWINNGGNLLIGKTTTATTTNGANIDSSGTYNIARPSGGSAAVFYYTVSGASVGKIQINTSSTSYVTSSDYRLKENVSYDFDATTRLKQLKPARFNFISDANSTIDGFLAHEVQDIVPEAITGEKDAMKTEEYEVTPAVLDEDGNVITEAVMGTREVPDYQGIDQAKLVPLLVKTIQELEARITALENK